MPATILPLVGCWPDIRSSFWPGQSVVCLLQQPVRPNIVFSFLFLLNFGYDFITLDFRVEDRIEPEKKTNDNNIRIIFLCHTVSQPANKPTLFFFALFLFNENSLIKMYPIC